MLLSSYRPLTKFVTKKALVDTLCFSVVGSHKHLEGEVFTYSKSDIPEKGGWWIFRFNLSDQAF